MPEYEGILAVQGQLAAELASKNDAYILALKKEIAKLRCELHNANNLIQRLTDQSTATNVVGSEVRQIVAAYLLKHGYTHLQNEDAPCGCSLHECFMACGMPDAQCRGWRQEER